MLSKVGNALADSMCASEYSECFPMESMDRIRLQNTGHNSRSTARPLFHPAPPDPVLGRPEISSDHYSVRWEGGNLREVMIEEFFL